MSGRTAPACVTGGCVAAPTTVDVVENTAGADPSPTARPGIMVACRPPCWSATPRDHDRGIGRARRSGAEGDPGAASAGVALDVVRPVAPGRPRPGLGPVGAPARAACRALPRRQLHSRADGALRRLPDQERAPAADQLVPRPGTRIAPVPALPEPAVDGVRPDRDGDQPRHRLPLVHVPPAGALAPDHLLVRPPLRAQPLDRGVCGRRVPVPRLGRRHRLRDQGLRLGRLRRVDATVGLVDAPARVGLHLPRPFVAARRLPRRRLHHAHAGAALRDRVPGTGPAGAVAVPRPLRPVAPARSCRRRRGLCPVGVGLGHRPAAGAVSLCRPQPDSRRDRARERLRGPSDSQLALRWTALRRRAPGRGHRPRGGGHRGLHLALAHPRGRARPDHHLGGDAAHDLRAHDVGRALRHHSRQQRRLHPPLPNGRAAVGDIAGGYRHRLPGPAGARRHHAPACPRSGAAGRASRPGGVSSPGSASSGS